MLFRSLELCIIASIKLKEDLITPYVKKAGYEFRTTYMKYVIIHKGLSVPFAKWIASDKSSNVGSSVGRTLGKFIHNYENSFELLSQFVNCKNRDMLSNIFSNLDSNLKPCLYPNKIIRKHFSSYS